MNVKIILMSCVMRGYSLDKLIYRFILDYLKQMRNRMTYIKMCDVPEELLVQSVESICEEIVFNMHLPVIYNLPPHLLSDKRCDPSAFDKLTEHKALQKVLKRKNKKWRRKCKHSKDDTRNTERYSKDTWYLDGMFQYEYYMKNKYHKHLRAQRVFTEEEEYEEFAYFMFEGEEYEYNALEIFDMFEGEWDWKDYVDESGWGLDKYK